MIRRDYCGALLIFKAWDGVTVILPGEGSAILFAADWRTYLLADRSKSQNCLRRRCESGRYFQRIVGHLAQIAV
jgi:hypothetical protein